MIPGIGNSILTVQPPRTSTYGYFSGGATASSNASRATTDRIIFSSGVTSANTVSNLSLARHSLAGVSDTVAYGYFLGGYTPSAQVVTADRITFSSGVTTANTVSNLSQARYGLTGISDGSSHGYFSGGFTGSSVRVVTTDRIVFSTGVTAVNTVSNLSTAKYALFSLSDNSTYGYFAGGYTGTTGGVTSTDRINFSTGVNALNTASNISQGRNGACGLSDNSTYGYFAGGYNTAGIFVSITDRIVFSTGVTSLNTASALSLSRSLLASSSDGLASGYWAGGYTSTGSPYFTGIADRIIFSTGVTSANTASNLSTISFGPGGVSDSAV